MNFKDTVNSLIGSLFAERPCNEAISCSEAPFSSSRPIIIGDCFAGPRNDGIWLGDCFAETYDDGNWLGDCFAETYDDGNRLSDCLAGPGNDGKRLRTASPQSPFTMPGLVVFFFAALLLSSCQNHPQTNQKQKPCTRVSSLPVKYAKGFTVDYYDGFKVITIRDVKDTAKILSQYVLLPAKKPAPVGFENAEQITMPVHKTVCVSTSTTGEMGILNLTDSIAAVTDVELIYNQQLLGKIKSNQIADVGKQEINYEKLVELHPSFVFTSGGFDGGDKLQLKLNSLHIASVSDLEYKEQDPLGRAEWIKLIAAFYDREGMADSIFNAIENRYLHLKTLVAATGTRPAVFCNLPFKEIWYMPCGENYMAQLIDDAGGNFLWKDAKATNGLNLNLDYEAVYNKAAQADYWINTGFAASLHDIQSADKKNTLFKAYRTGNVYSNNKRNTPAGGFDFWESGPVKPDEILADLITIFHPGLLKGHELYYYQKLK